MKIALIDMRFCGILSLLWIIATCISAYHYNGYIQGSTMIIELNIQAY